MGVRERMLRATLKLIADGGVATVTNRRVADRRRRSRLAQLAFHFASQAQLLRESLLLHVEEETARRQQIARELSKTETREYNRSRKPSSGSWPSPESSTQARSPSSELHLQAARDPELREASQRCFEAHEQIAQSAFALNILRDS